MDLSEVKEKIQTIGNKLEDINKTLNIQELKNNLKDLEEKTTTDGFWDDLKMSSEILKKIKEVKQKLATFNKVYLMYENICVSKELLEEENDEELKDTLDKDLKLLENETQKLEVSSLLFEQYDSLNAIVTIHAGAGGTESQDWAQMLQRMYTRWCERTGFIVEVYDIQEGDEAGVKSVTFGVKGLYAYGYIKSEKGVHRLVRISPFDANKRRHTSFAAVDVMPEIEDTIELDIRSEDLEIGTYRASGAGGQHINKTDSAVRIKHIPTGIVVSCQTERSQIQNRETCMRMLRAKLYQYEQNKTQERLKEIKGELSENGWGSQIRSYVFCPYTLVKDHRTNFEVGNVYGVMDGDLDDFIAAYLKQNAIENKK